MRFRTIELLVAVSIIGFGCVSLKQSDPLFETMFFLVGARVCLGLLSLSDWTDNRRPGVQGGFYGIFGFLSCVRPHA